MHLTPDQVIFFQSGIVKINATLINTWLIMFALVVGSIILSRNLCSGKTLNHWQNILELIITESRKQLHELGIKEPDRCLPFVSTIFLFIAVSAVSGIIPGVEPPIASLSTTAALATCVFIAVPIYGISSHGPASYVKSYFQPIWIMFPFNIIGELTRTLALAVRLFGNSMSATMVVAIFLGIAPLFFPILMRLLGLLTGLVQAYIFAVLASLYIAAGIRSHNT